jgi:hypothetical protein
MLSKGLALRLFVAAWLFSVTLSQVFGGDPPPPPSGGGPPLPPSAAPVYAVPPSGTDGDEQSLVPTRQLDSGDGGGGGGGSGNRPPGGGPIGTMCRDRGGKGGSRPSGVFSTDSGYDVGGQDPLCFSTQVNSTFEDFQEGGVNYLDNLLRQENLKSSLQSSC